MNTIETIRAEIERLREAQLDKNGNSKDLFCSIRLWAYADLLSFIDTLQEPEKEPDIAKVLPDVVNELTWGKQEPEVDLEEAADNHIRKVVDTAGHPGWDWETQDIADAFKAGAEWQKQKVLSLIESRLSQILGDAQPKPILRAELRDLIDLIKG